MSAEVEVTRYQLNQKILELEGRVTELEEDLARLTENLDESIAEMQDKFDDLKRGYISNEDDD